MRNYIPLLLSIILASSFAQNQPAQPNAPAASTTVQCHKYHCAKPDLAATHHNKCYMPGPDNSIVLQPCLNQLHCPGIYEQLLKEPGTHENRELTCSPNMTTPFAYPPGYPGDMCIHNESCLTNNCESKTHTCAGGLDENAVCNEEMRHICKIGLSCVNHTCKKQVAEGGTCIASPDCTNDCFCSADKKCAKYFSIKEGQKSSGQETHKKFTTIPFSLDCASHHQTPDGKCAQPGRSLANYSNMTCTSDTDCKLSDGTFAPCVCGRNNEGHATCHNGPGDPIYDEIQEHLTKVISNNSKCHTHSRFSLRCHDIYAQVEHLEGLIYWAENSPKLRNDLLCVGHFLWYPLVMKNMTKEVLQIPFNYPPGKKEDEKPKGVPVNPFHPTKLPSAPSQPSQHKENFDTLVMILVVIGVICAFGVVFYLLISVLWKGLQTDLVSVGDPTKVRPVSISGEDHDEDDDEVDEEANKIEIVQTTNRDSHDDFDDSFVKPKKTSPKQKAKQVQQKKGRYHGHDDEDEEEHHSDDDHRRVDDSGMGDDSDEEAKPKKGQSKSATRKKGGKHKDEDEESPEEADIAMSRKNKGKKAAEAPKETTSKGKKKKGAQRRRSTDEDEDPRSIETKSLKKRQDNEDTNPFDDN